MSVDNRFRLIVEQAVTDSVSFLRLRYSADCFTNSQIGDVGDSHESANGIQLKRARPPSTAIVVPVT